MQELWWTRVYLILGSGSVITLSELFLRVTDFPSRTISSMLTLPVASAFWLVLYLGTAIEPSSSSTRFLFAREVREELLLLLATVRDTVTREDGLGDNFSLEMKCRLCF